MNETKREFIKKAGLLSAAGLFAAIPSASGQQMNAGATSSSVFNVKDFGAKGDGQTSDSEAIQQALDAAGKVQGTAYFPAGKYRCHDLKVHPHTTVLAEPQWAYGPDGGAVLSIDSDDADCVLDITEGCGCHIRGIFLRGNKRASKVQHGILQNNSIWTKHLNAPVIDEVSINTFSGNGIYLIRARLLIIRHSIFFDNAGHGVSLRDGGDGFVMDNQFSGNGKCGFATEIFGASIMFTANRVEWNHEYGLYLAGGNTWHIVGSDAWNVTGNCFDRNWGAAIYANNMSDCTFTGNIFRRNGRDASKLQEGTEESCQMLIQSCRGLAITGNTGTVDADDDGRGEYTPNYVFWLKDSYCSVITGNAFSGGFVKDFVLDKGGNQTDFLISNNVASVFDRKRYHLR